jgi:predicted nucleotidyltransferase
MSLRLTTAEQRVLDQFRAWVGSRFSTRVRELVLFGSRARGQGHEDSDLDVAVVIDDLTASEARELGYFAGDMLTAHNVVLSPFAVSTEHMARLRSRERAIALDIARDGVPL